MKVKKLQEYNKKRIMIIVGSARSENNCPGENSKTSKIVEEAIKDLPEDIELDLVDLSIQPDKPVVQPCKGCISTAGGAHCHWWCDCYSKGNKDNPDFMSDFDIYQRLQKCDAFIVFSPINWWSVTSQVKAFFDRLVCTSLTIDYNQAKELLGEKNLKNPKKTKELEKSEDFKKLIKNHLEGKVAAFYVHGDEGADDYVDFKKPKTMTGQNITKCGDPINAILPIVYQCRYMAINAPDELIEAFAMNENISYAEANEKMDDGKLKFAIKKAKDLIIKTFNFLK